MIVKPEQDSVATVCSLVGIECGHILFRNARHFFHDDFLSGHRRTRRRRKNFAVIAVGLDMNPQGAMRAGGLHGRDCNQEAAKKKRGGAPRHARLIKGLTRFATAAEYRLMKRALTALLLVLAVQISAHAQDEQAPPRPEKRSIFNRILHPFRSSEEVPEYKDARLNGLVLAVEVSPQPVKLSEVRQMDVRVTLTNRGRRPVPLEFPDSQRFEIRLRTSAGGVLTTWSENHAFADTPGSVMINPQEKIEYAETIATRELSPNRVFIVEASFPKYPELRVQQKFMTAP